MNPKDKAYPYYGGRGISVCERWLNDKQNFYDDIGTRPPGLTLDRVDNDGDYTPENCEWRSRKDQQRNQRITRRVIIEGRSYLAVELADISGLKTDSIVERAKLGLTYTEVIDSKKRVFHAGLALGGKANGECNRAKTHCPKGHEYTPENIRASKVGQRGCKKCAATRERERQRIKRSGLNG